MAVRFAELFARGPLWLDETLIALNILTRPFAGLFHPLADKQIAPLCFLLGEWVASRLAGPGELVFRLIPFAAGVAALVAFERLARRLLEPRPALLAAAVWALSPLLIRYSAEVKPYSLDALAAVLLVHATLDVAESVNSGRALARWSLVAAAASLVSTSAPFVVAGCAIGLLSVHMVRGTPIGITRLFLACVPAAGLFLAQLLTLYASMRTSTFMQTYWGEFFPHPPVGTAIREAVGLGRLVWVFLLLGSPSEPMLPAKTLTVLLLLWIGGIVTLLRRGVLPVAVLLAPLVLTFVAALMKRWPLAPRLLLFLAPTMLLPLAAGVGAASSLLPKRGRLPVFALAAGALMLPVALGAGRVLLEPPEFTPLPAALETIAAEPGAASVAYISPELVPPCRWHQFRSGRAEVGSALPECLIDGVTTVTGRDPAYPERGVRRDPAELLARRTEWATAELTRLQPLVKGALWVVMWKGTSVREPIGPALEQAGARLLESRIFDTVELYRYHLPSR